MDSIERSVTEMISALFLRELVTISIRRKFDFSREIRQQGKARSSLFIGECVFRDSACLLVLNLISWHKMDRVPAK